MELPEYRLPRLNNIYHFVLEEIISLFYKTSTIIVLTNET